MDKRAFDDAIRKAKDEIARIRRGMTAEQRLYLETCAVALGVIAVLAALRYTESPHVFGVEAIVVGALAAAFARRARITRTQLDRTSQRVAELAAVARQARVTEQAFGYVEAVTSETAALVVNRRGVITEWRPSADRLYGHPADTAVGANVDLLAYPSAGPSVTELLDKAARTGVVRQPSIHRRHDGARFEADVTIARGGDPGLDAFIVIVHDLTRLREWEDFRRAAARAQNAQDAEAERMRQQLTTIESITDPCLSPLNVRENVHELLERARQAVEADGLAVVLPVGAQTRVMAALGVQPERPAPRSALTTRQYQTGRVTIVHNDSTRVSQASALSWPDSVSSLMLVPVMSGGRLHSIIEVVNERPRRSTDWDLALIRIVADRISTIEAGADYGRAGAVA